MIKCHCNKGLMIYIGPVIILLFTFMGHIACETRGNVVRRNSALREVPQLVNNKTLSEAMFVCEDEMHSDKSCRMIKGCGHCVVLVLTVINRSITSVLKKPPATKTKRFSHSLTVMMKKILYYLFVLKALFSKTLRLL